MSPNESVDIVHKAKLLGCREGWNLQTGFAKANGQCLKHYECSDITLLEKVSIGIIWEGQVYWLTVEYLFPGKEDNTVIVKFVPRCSWNLNLHKYSSNLILV